MLLNDFLLWLKNWNLLWCFLFLLWILFIRTMIRHMSFELLYIDFSLNINGRWFFFEERRMRLLSHDSFHNLFLHFIKLSWRFFINKNHFYFFFLRRLWNKSLLITTLYSDLHSVLCKYIRITIVLTAIVITFSKYNNYQISLSSG